MTISSENSRMDYVGNGATTVYPYTFKIMNQAHLVVTKLVLGVEINLTLTTDYTVSGVGAQAGGNVTLTTALANGIPLVIRRVVPVLQLTDIKNQGAFYPEIHEDEFDAVVMMVQQQQEEIDRAVKVPVTGGSTPETYLASLSAFVTAFLAGIADVAAAIHAAGNKATPVDADEVGIWDSVSGLLKKVTWANLKAALKAYFDTLYQALGSYAALAGSASQTFSVAAATAAAHATRWDTPNMGSLTVTQNTGALTFAGIAHPLTFRSTTLTDGAVSTIIADPADLVLPSGGTLGFITAVQGRIVVAEMNNGGTSEYAICNFAGGLQIDETNLISTTAIGTGSDSNNVWYSTSSRSNLPYKIVGFVDVVNTAGAWGNPVLVQAAGGNAAAAMGSLGYGQTWQTFTPGVNRLIATTYYNTTGRPIMVSIMGQNYTSGGVLTVNGITVGYQAVGGATGYNTTITAIVPVGGSYDFATGGGNPTYWAELR